MPELTVMYPHVLEQTGLLSTLVSVYGRRAGEEYSSCCIRHHTIQHTEMKLCDRIYQHLAPIKKFKH